MIYLQILFKSLIPSLIIVIMGCNNSVIVPDEEFLPVQGVTLRDVANSGNVSDFRVSFSTITSNDLIKEHRVYLVKTAELSLATLENLSNNNFYLSISPETGFANFPTNFKDINAGVVSEEINYSAIVMTLGTSDAPKVISKPSSGAMLSQTTYVATLANIANAGTGGMDVDSEGNIYMGDFGKDTNGGGNKVFKITADGEVSIFATGFNTASGNDFDSKGNLFQSSFDGKFISKIAPNGDVEKFIASDPLITGPVGIAIDSNDDLFVADWRSNAILKITEEKKVTIFANTNLNGPNGLDFDNNGNLYVANWNDNNIIKIGPDGTSQIFANTPNNNAHLLVNNGFIYTVGRPQHNIFRIGLSDAEITPILNNGRGVGDGTLQEAQLSYPNDLAFSPDGKKMYINHTQDVSPNGFTISPSIIRVVHFSQ